MKRLFSITLFFWACTFTQQAQPIESALDITNNVIWSTKLLASGLEGDLILPYGTLLSEKVTTQDEKIIAN